MKLYLGIPLLLALTAGAYASPRIEIVQPRWNFGVVTNLIELQHEFVVRNSGDEPLRISRVVSSCNACLRAAIDKSIILPGAETVVRSRLDLRNFSGSVSRAILIECNDPKSRAPMLELTGFMVPAYHLFPTELTLDLSAGQTAGTVEISPILKLGADLSEVSCQDTNIEATVSKKASGTYLLAVRTKPGIPTGNINDILDICSPNSNDLPCRVVLFIHHPPDLELIPSQLRFQSEAGRQMRIIWLKQHGVAPWTLLDVVSPSDQFRCEIEPDPVGPNYRVYVTALQLPRPALQTNALCLKFANLHSGEKQSVSLPIYVDSLENN